MDLLSKAVIAAVVLVVIAVVLISVKGIVPLHHTQLNATTVSTLVVSDLQQAYPNATVKLLSANRSYSSNDSWSVTLLVVYGPRTPCPTIKVEDFDYPETGLLPTVTEVYSNYSDGMCHVYGLPNSALPYFSYTVTSPESAIDRAYNSDYPPLVQFINQNGFSNVTASASFLNKTTSVFGENYTNVWLVRYSSANTAHNDSQYVLMNYSGGVLTGYLTMLNYTKNFSVT